MLNLAFRSHKRLIPSRDGIIIASAVTFLLSPVDTNPLQELTSPYSLRTHHGRKRQLTVILIFGNVASRTGHRGDSDLKMVLNLLFLLSRVPVCF